MVDEAHLIQLHFNSLNTALSNVHKAISHTKPIEHSYLPDMQSSIDTYMSIYRKTFSQKVIPKQHLLERHCIPYIRQQTFGLGLLGEQGTQLNHQAMSKLERERAFGIPNELDRLKHIIFVCPFIANCSSSSMRRHLTVIYIYFILYIFLFIQPLRLINLFIYIYIYIYI